MIGAVVINGFLQLWVAKQPWFIGLAGHPDDRGALLLMFGTVLVNALWITVTLKTAPESTQTLHRFYRRVQPPGPGWARIARECGMEPEALDWRDFAAFAGGVALIWGALYLVGQLMFGEYGAAAVGFAVTAAGGWLVYAFLITRADRDDTLEGERDAHDDVDLAGAT